MPTFQDGVWLTHPEHGEHKVPNNPGVIAYVAGRGYAVTDLPAELEPDDPDFVEAVEKLRTGEQVAELKGKALDDALDAAGLSKSGTVEEKRARLTEHEAAEVVTTPAESATDKEGNE
jgi:hypothetical protein